MNGQEQLMPQIVPIPVIIPSDNVPQAGQALQYSPAVYGLPGTNVQGLDLITHLQFSIKAKINLEWCDKTILHLSNNATYLIKLPWALDYLLEQLQTKFDKTSALSLRNLSQDSDFTQMLALHPKTKLVLSEVLKNYKGVPTELTEQTGKVVDNELLVYTVDIVESVSSYYAPAPKDDDLFMSLTKIFMDTVDRSLSISIMRSFARFLVRSELSTENCASNFTQQMLDKITSFILTDDYDLVLTSLDFIYQYTLPGNTRISHLLKSSTRRDILRNRLPQLLTFQQNIKGNPNDIENLQPLKLIKRTKPPVPTTAPKLSDEHYAAISQLQEPLRATAWMRCCYRSVAESEVTQISLWKAYESQFEKDIASKKLLPAVDFIKNVSQAFTNSSAMVISLANGQRKFIIKGIEPRYSSVDIKTGDYEAFSEVQNTEYSATEISTPSHQEKPEEYHPPTTLNDVNNSTVMLLASLVNHPSGSDLYKPLEEVIFKKMEAFPALFDELVDVLKHLQE
ncbi:Chromatin structure-remodeling complex subunit RSC9 [Cyberlindnera fabianii]|uniref:Chromatin structure-remodeling complex subunit RSC9 n=1 Tax=Cyberlindnera fabianii TaxID=36022 RepID=A0A1V2L013_CYBFA|nr:Chromatin structure-remodeling complex subunit RSC9 [Cyberlindnera fabianii]